MSTPAKFRPFDIKGSAKFGNNNPRYSTPLRGASLQESENISWLLAHSLAKNTWNTYDTAEKVLRIFCAEKNIPTALPLSSDTVIHFVTWLACDRKLSAPTVTVYLSSIRHLHTQHNLPVPNVRSDFVKALIQGKRNSELAGQSLPKRKPVTADLLLDIKKKLAAKNKPLSYKRMAWSACTMLFFGACRASEILVQHTAKFDSVFSFTDKKIQLQQNSSGQKKLVLELTAPKESKNCPPVFIEIFQAANREICPVAAWEKWQQCRRTGTGPHFREDGGKPFTISALNKELKEICGSESGISSHSFRIGAATAMGSLGFQDKDIQAVGRWKSQAYDRYIRHGKFGRSRAAATFSKIF